MIWFDPTYFLLVLIPAVVLSAGVQLYLRRTYQKWSTVRNGIGLNGMQVGQQLINRTSLQAVTLATTPGVLTDHFDPRANTVRLSQPVAGGASVAAMAVAAHELGHVQQHQNRSSMMRIRGFLVPALRFSPILSYILIIIGLFANIAGLIWLGVLFFGLVVLFSVLTLPIEMDASRRALRMLTEANLLTSDQDRSGAKAVLNAAALTYLAAAAIAILQLLYYLSLARR